MSQPNPADMVGSIDTSGISPGPHARPEGVTAIFDMEEDRIKERKGDASEYFRTKKRAASGETEDKPEPETEPEPEVEPGNIDTSPEAPPVGEADVHGVDGADEGIGGVDEDDGDTADDVDDIDDDAKVELTHEQWDQYRIVDLMRIAEEQDPPVEVTPGSKKQAIIESLIEAGAKAEVPD